MLTTPTVINVSFWVLVVLFNWCLWSVVLPNRERDAYERGRRDGKADAQWRLGDMAQLDE